MLPTTAASELLMQWTRKEEGETNKAKNAWKGNRNFPRNGEEEKVQVKGQRTHIKGIESMGATKKMNATEKEKEAAAANS